MRTFLLILLIALAGGPSIAPAQTVVGGTVMITLAQELTPGEMELARQTVEQRNNRAYLHVFMAFAAAWLLILVYAVTIGRRFGKLENEIRQLRRS